MSFLLSGLDYRASPDWGAKLGYSPQALADANAAAIEFLREVAHGYRDQIPRLLIGGIVGPRGDAYGLNRDITADSAEDYHAVQLKTLKALDVDYACAMTFNNVPEAIGAARAAAKIGVPLSVALTLDRTSRLKSGPSLAEAIIEIDARTGEEAPDFYLLNCSHPLEYEPALDDGGWIGRLRGVRPNASKMEKLALCKLGHLEDGDPVELGAQLGELSRRYPHMDIFGGCCGTGDSHLREIASGESRQPEPETVHPSTLTTRGGDTSRDSPRRLIVSQSHLAQYCAPAPGCRARRARARFRGGKPMPDRQHGKQVQDERPTLTRRHFLERAIATGGLLGLTPQLPSFAQEARREPAAPSNVALQLARQLNRVGYEELPPLAIEHAKMIIASTLASAALGSDIESAAILRDLAKEHGGKPEATVWFDGMRLPAIESARVNAMLSDAAASDDSDIRNTAHYGTALTSVGLAIGERTGATGRDLLRAMVIGYEAAGRLGEARTGGRGGIHASQIVGFAGAAAGASLLNLGDERMAQALGLAAFTMGGMSIGTMSLARQYMGANAAYCGAYSALVASRGYIVNDESLDGGGGWIGVYGGGDAQGVLRERDEWGIVRYLAIKLWPGAHPFSGTVEAAVNAIREAGLPPSEIVRILVSGRGRTGLTGSRRINSYTDGITSMRYFIASAVKDRDFSWVHATPEKMFDPALNPLMDMIEIDPEPPAVQYEWGWGGTVTLVTRSGARFTSTVQAPRGSGPRGIDWADVDAKYRTLMPNSGLSQRRIEETLAMIHRFERVEDVAELTRLLS